MALVSGTDESFSRGASLWGRLLAAVVVRTLGALSFKGVSRLAKWLGLLAWQLRVRRRVTLDNLRQALPEKSEAEREAIARAAYQNMALAALEGLGAVHLSDAEVEARVRIENWAPLQAAIKEGKGVVVATAHFGSWELLGSLMARRQVPLTAVVRRLAGAFNAQIIESRRKNGMELIPPRGALKGAVSALRKGRVVVMLMDQVLPARHGVFVPFFGRPACTNPSAAVASLRTSAPVFVVMAPREGDGLRMIVEGPITVPRTGDTEEDIRAHTAAVTHVLERTIRAHPEQWLWMHRRWKVQPRG